MKTLSSNSRFAVVGDAVAVETGAQVFHHRQQPEDAPVFRHIADAHARQLVRRQAGDVSAFERDLAPACAGTSPMIDFKVVLLPTPLRPSSPTTSPGATVSETPCRIWLLP